MSVLIFIPTHPNHDDQVMLLMKKVFFSLAQGIYFPYEIFFGMDQIE